MKILIYGDVMGRIGREAVKRTLPGWKTEHDIDLTIANAENLAQGKGITKEVLDDLLQAGVDFFTSGNHVWDKRDAFEVFADPRYSDKIIRPANYPAGAPGQGAKLLTVGTKNVLVVNLLGRVFGKVLVDDPFRTFDTVLAAHSSRSPSVVLVDFHGDATSERGAFGWHADGRATAVWGTHTHVPTRDERTLPGGTAFITDVGMTGFRDGVLGVERAEIVRNFMTQLPVKHEIPDHGEAIVNAIVVETGATASIRHLQQVVTI